MQSSKFGPFRLHEIYTKLAWNFTWTTPQTSKNVTYNIDKVTETVLPVPCLSNKTVKLRAYLKQNNDMKWKFLQNTREKKNNVGFKDVIYAPLKTNVI